MKKQMFILLSIGFCFEILNAAKCSRLLVPCKAQAYFNPCILPVITGLINAEQKSIHLACYTLTSRAVAEALAKARQVNKVEVEIVVDAYTAMANNNQLPLLLEAGVTLFQFMGHVKNTKGTRVGIMHNKFGAFKRNLFFGTPESIVETGSANKTGAAYNQNCENLVVMASQDFYEIYRKEFSRIRLQCVRLKKIR
jgi:phosphatidylserine/phosphatidylglycerophosphate/cardiolipin synthase-like enzyme